MSKIDLIVVAIILSLLCSSVARSDETNYEKKGFELGKRCEKKPEKCKNRVGDLIEYAKYFHSKEDYEIAFLFYRIALNSSFSKHVDNQTYSGNELVALNGRNDSYAM